MYTWCQALACGRRPRHLPEHPPHPISATARGTAWREVIWFLPRRPFTTSMRSESWGLRLSGNGRDERNTPGRVNPFPGRTRCQDGSLRTLLQLTITVMLSRIAPMPSAANSYSMLTSFGLDSGRPLYSSAATLCVTPAGITVPASPP